MLPAKFFLCSIVGSDGESLCGNISQFVGPTLAPKGHVIELTTYFGALPCLGYGNQTATDEARSWFEAHADVFRGEARAAPAPASHRTAAHATRGAARVGSAPPIDPMVPPPPYTKCSL